MDRNLMLLERVQEGDASAKEELCRDNMRLVQSIAARFAGRGTELCDLVQIGFVGLIKAISCFDLSRGVKFSTYAVPMITGEIKRFLRDDGMIRVSRGLKERRRSALAAEEKLRRRLGREPTVTEVAAECGLAVGELMEAYEACTPVESIDLPSDNSVSMEERVGENREEEVINRILTDQLLSQLDERSRTVLTLRYFEDKTQSEIARILGISQVHISRIERSALLKLRTIASE